ncbi:hypothetical protein BD414DRAFT_491340 [Trametes punicea]|nr:hypothetical protein BD414DRAFT_491340 [Trametes punicea]
MAPSQCSQCQDVFISKRQCRNHMMASGHTGAAFFICLECSQTFQKMRSFREHRQSSGHTATGITLSSMPTRIGDRQPTTASSQPFPKAPTCTTCDKHFTTFHELSEHLREMHGREFPVELKCPRCSQAILFGEVHSCDAPKRVACSICRQRFGSAAELAEHTTANALSCEVCGIHLPPGMKLEDHWRLSNRHAFCDKCGRGFQDRKALIAHTADCSLTTTPLAQGTVVVFGSKSGQPPPGLQMKKSQEADSCVNKVDVLFATDEPAASLPCTQTEWFLSGLPQSNSGPVADRVSSRRSSLSAVDKVSENSGELGFVEPDEPGGQLTSPVRPCTGDENSEKSPTTAQPDAVQGNVADAALADALVQDFGKHNIDRILSVLEEPGPEFNSANDSDSEKRSELVRSLLPPRSSCSGSDDAACATSLATNYSSQAPSPTWSELSDARPLLGERQGPQKPRVPDEVLPRKVHASPEVASAKVVAWLQDQARIRSSRQIARPTTRPSAANVPASSSDNSVQARLDRGNYGEMPMDPTSWRCKSCLQQPVDPVAALCGHIFCHSCIFNELADSMHCPVCKMVYLTKLET